jgi:hypothetical protein
MRICAAWHSKHVVATPSSPAIWHGKPSAFMSERFSLTPALRLLGRGFLVRTRSFTSDAPTLLPPLDAMLPKALWRMFRDWSRTRLRPCSPWVIINITC